MTSFGLRVDVEATNLSGKTTRNWRFREVEAGSGRQIAGNKNNYLQQRDNFFQSYDFTLPADKAGIEHYRITLSDVEGEASKKITAAIFM